jgi:hypothetical protein
VTATGLLQDDCSQTEVADLDGYVLVQEDVGGFNISMYNTLLMNIWEDKTKRSRGNSERTKRTEAKRMLAGRLDTHKAF